jgi:hypothetical protein
MFLGGGAMSNASRARLHARDARNKPEIMAAVRAGYHDALAGLGYRAEYETMKAYQQRNYTSGRLMAMEFLAKAAKPPAWPDSVKLPRCLEAIAQDVAQSFVQQPPA